MAQKKENLTLQLTGSIKELIAKGIDNEKLKQKVQEYIEASKFKMKIAKEIMVLAKEQSNTVGYLDELEEDLKQAEAELNSSKEVEGLLRDMNS